ncbi:hypothetical protein B2M27_25710, partial [Kluyvera intermedia]
KLAHRFNVLTPGKTGGDEMALINRKYNPKAVDTAFILESSGKLVCRLDTKLPRDDWESLQALFGFIYNQAFEAGSEQRAQEIRKSLGIGVSS